MPAVRINMRKLKDALRLKFAGELTHTQIAQSLGISKGVVTKYVGLAVAAGLDGAAVASMDEASLERRLLPAQRPGVLYAQVDFGRIHQELGRKGVTLMLLWEEYCAQVGDDHCESHPVKHWRYSQFCENYRQFAKRLKRSMRQVHRAGAKLFTRLRRLHPGFDFARRRGRPRQHLCRCHGCVGLLFCLCHAGTNRA